jgi:leucyl-tRNA synthetase
MKKLFLFLVIATASFASYAKVNENTTAISVESTHNRLSKKTHSNLTVFSKTNAKKSNSSIVSIHKKKSLASTKTKTNVVLAVGSAEDNCRQIYNQTIRMLKDAIYSEYHEENPADEWIITLIATEQFQECMREANGVN